MKKINLVSITALSLATLAMGGTAFAEEEIVIDPIKAQNEATVLFEADNGTDTPVVTPPGGETDKPGTVVTGPGDSDGSQGNGSNSFNITWVSNFRFNDRAEGDTDFTQFSPIALNANGMKLWAKGTKLTIEDEENTKTTYENIPNFIQILDNRGENSGWNLQAQMTDFVGSNKDGDTQTLAAELSLNHLNANGPIGIAAPTFNESIVLSQEAATVMSAETDAGMGSWSLNFGDSDEAGVLVEKTGVKLDIPAGAKANYLYTANINWTLTDAPAN